MPKYTKDSASTTLAKRMKINLRQTHPDFEHARVFLRNREIKVINVFQIARMELKRRGWNKNCATMKETNACSLVTLIDFACLNVLKENDDFSVRRTIIYETLDECVSVLTKNKTRSFVQWEHSQRTTEERVLQLLDMCITECVKSFT